MKVDLANLYDKGSLPHALILQAQASLASILVNELIEKLAINVADYLILNQSTTLKVVDARAIRLFATMSRFTSPIKLIFIADAHLLTPEAANSLLKTLEEPPKGTYIVLATPRPEALLPTIRSRCQLLMIAETDTENYDLTVEALTNQSLADYFALAKQLAASDTPLPRIFESWIANLSSLPQNRKRARQLDLLLTYLGPAQTPVNRRLLLDNFFLSLYNTD